MGGGTVRRGSIVAMVASLAVFAVACGSSSPASSASATSAAPTSVASSPASAASAVASVPAGPTADPILAGTLDKLNGLTSYRFKLTVKGGAYATSVGAAGLAGTVVNKPSFAVQFTYVDLEVIEIQGKNWTKNGSRWDLSPYPKNPTTYDSYGPAVQLGHYFTPSVAAYYSAVGDETVNGVATTHYKADPKILNYMVANWGVTAANGKADGLKQAGDIWIAKDGGYPVRWHVVATGGVAGPGSGGSADFDYSLDITRANDPANKISVPAS